MSGYDEIMEARYQRQLEEDERYTDWCEERDLDPEMSNVRAAFEQWMQDAEDDYASELAEELYYDRL